MRFVFATILAVSISLVIIGCPLASQPSPSVLAGNWSLSTVDGTDVIATFDTSGKLISLSGTLPDGTTATLPIAGSTTVFDGNQFIITIVTPDGEIIFEGILSLDSRTLSGLLSATLVIDDSTLITLPSGDLIFNNDSTNSNSNDNTDDNMNENDNTSNTNDNANRDLNENDNQGDPDEDGNDNSNDNGNDNAGDDTNTNMNGNDNSVDNGNENDNSDDNSNDNTSDNTNDNSSINENDNSTGNGNDNDNHNDNGSDNDNS